MEYTINSCQGPFRALLRKMAKQSTGEKWSFARIGCINFSIAQNIKQYSATFLLKYD